jgi:hypothetical protein
MKYLTQRGQREGAKTLLEVSGLVLSGCSQIMWIKECYVRI